MSESGRKVLVAEDCTQEAVALATLLRSWGYVAVVVTDGQAALDQLNAPEGPRLALLDWGMPGLDGVGVCRELRRDPTGPYVYAILVTGRHERGDRVAGLAAGADDFITKPIDLDELRARMATGRRILDLEHRLMEAQARLKEQATRDSLTGLWNRAAILEMLEKEITRSGRDGQPVGVLMVDMDYFKQVNDTLGHMVGDQVLRQAAQRMLGGLRPYDSVGRYGGEEFLVVLPGCGEDQVLGLAERLRMEMASTPIATGTVCVQLTISLGAAWWPAEFRGDAGALLYAADEALYRAKMNGRNQAAMAPTLSIRDGRRLSELGVESKGG